ncbi:octicosapeptide/Phox/Bem1p family protein [Striga asiatica]|uniref:Octicosapeptide/Phox/Bem1p family protein n=1 Tax=Striga asiatica TaxID=4170 RepID=A0A5A7PSW7_STRAF|nr:octicosapeptide/Phox/Bem1p family protein [Striga asiatica]
MELATPPPAGTVTTSPRPPIVPSKLRLMCSYGGHILPRPHDKSLFYAGGETRIVALDRRTTAASLSALSAHLSRALLNNRPFLLKYQLPSEDLDSLISVLTDEDLSNMLEEHDRIDPPARIRLFLFPIKPESVGSALLDPKSDTWFSDALKSTGVLQKGQSADSGLLMSIVPDLETPLESGCMGGGGGEGKLSAESLVLETSSSFGSTSSSFSMSNSPPIGINQCDEKGVKLDRSIRVPSSASIESEIRLASLSAPPPKPGFLQEPLIQVDQDESSENPVSEASLNITFHKPTQVIGYPISQLPDGKKQQSETQLIQGGLHYIPQYPGPVQIPPYYPLYQTPIHPQHISCPPNQPYPIYLVPVTPSQYPNMSMLYNSSDANTTTTTSVLPPLHPQATLPAQPKVYPTATQLVGLPSDQGLAEGPPEPQTALESVNTTASEGNEFEEDIVYNQIYKTQPLPPVVTPQNQMMTTGMKLVEPSVQFQQKKPC